MLAAMTERERFINYIYNDQNERPKTYRRLALDVFLITSTTIGQRQKCVELTALSRRTDLSVRHPAYGGVAVKATFRPFALPDS